MIVESKKLTEGSTVVFDAAAAPKNEEEKANDLESVTNPVKIEDEAPKQPEEAKKTEEAKKPEEAKKTEEKK